MGKIIDGKEIARKKREEVKEKVLSLKEKGINPGLAVVIVGDDPSSQIYVRNKHRACVDVGIMSRQYALSAETSEGELIRLVDELNNDPAIHGILVQSPLPGHIDQIRISSMILPSKDVDVFHPANIGNIMTGRYGLLPCTPAGVVELIKSTGCTIEGKDAVVVGRSNIVGKPMAMMLLHENATVTVCHSKTTGLADITKRADILVVAIGKANFIKANMIKQGAIVIDVGTNRLPDGKLTGDTNFEECLEKAGYITPVPGGVGPMTIAMLLENTVKAANNS